MSVISNIIENGKRNHGDLTVQWLNLTNAYGTIAHKLVELTLKTYHVPGQFQYYFDKFSVIIFSTAMNLLVKSAEKLCQGAVRGIQQVPIRAFMENIMISISST